MHPADPGITPPATAAYIPSLISRIRAAHPALPFDAVVLQSILLCLIARTQKPVAASFCTTNGEDAQREGSGGSAVSMNLVLRTRAEDVGLLSHVVTLILTTVFGFSTHRHKVVHLQARREPGVPSVGPDPSFHPDAFLRALFFRFPKKRHHGPSRSYAPQRSSSYPAPSSSLYVSAVSEPDSVDQHTSLAEHDRLLDTDSLASSRRPLRSSVTPASTLRLQRPAPERTRTDPLPLLSMFAPLEGDDISLRPSLPQAVVVSGLESAGFPAQRALLRVLSEGKMVLQDNEDEMGISFDLVGTWNLPDDFLMVYVCKWDPHERPAVLRGLLDQFAMSADIVLESSTRQAFAAYHSTQAGTPHGSPIYSPRALPSELFSTPSGTPTSTSRPPFRRASSRIATPVLPPVISPSEVAHLRALARRVPDVDAHAYTSMHSSLRAYLSDLFAATRHHPSLDGTLLTYRAHEDAEALIRAYRVLVGDSIGTELVRVAGAGSALGGDGDDEYSAESGEGTLEWEKSDMDWMVGRGATGKSRMSNDTYMSDNTSNDEHVVRLNIGIDLEGESSKGKQSAEENFAQPPGFRDSDDDRLRDAIRLRGTAEVWDVSEVDVARVFPRVVSHRLRVRNGPDHEILGSLMWPAVDIWPIIRDASVSPGNTPRPEIGETRWVRKTVKEILVGILADV